LEWARNDYSSSLDHILRYPFHTVTYTFGINKVVPINNSFYGEILLEITNLECSQDYDRLLTWHSTFYAHGIIIQGHTNGGQWFGAGMGTGGNSQYLGFQLYFNKGYGGVFIQRRNPDLDFTWYIDSKKYDDIDFPGIAEGNIRMFLDFGISGLFYITNNLSVGGMVVIRDERNPLNQSVSYYDDSSVHRYNFSVSASIRYLF
jgi:hypothetical protein